MSKLEQAKTKYQRELEKAQLSQLVKEVGSNALPHGKKEIVANILVIGAGVALGQFFGMPGAANAAINVFGAAIHNSEKNDESQSAIELAFRRPLRWIKSKKGTEESSEEKSNASEKLERSPVC